MIPRAEYQRRYVRAIHFSDAIAPYINIVEDIFYNTKTGTVFTWSGMRVRNPKNRGVKNGM